VPDDRVKSIFNDALERAGAERVAFLDGACGGDAALRAQVEALLAVHAGAGEFLSEQTSDDVPAGDSAEFASAVTTAVPAPLSERPGTVIGPYKLLQQIGEGGFGVVFMAEQEQPVRRRVALKIIKLGMDTKQVVARFEAERQALALMEHPNIAKVLDGGATEAGRPYFVMELVKGDPVTDYCDRNNLSTQQRLELFRSICHAVQHAHQKGIIHRDLKPGNVLVTVADGVPIPMVIDFGIAKATSARLTEKTVFTEFRQLIGTPEYMSPEQAEMSGVDIDTRSDIYSLGVLLYELLTGTTPFTGRKLRSAAFGELQRIIREEEPERPSTRVSGLRSASTAVHGGSNITPDEAAADEPDTSIEFVARHRHTDPRALVRSLRGDLDWIVMRCLEKDRTRRYETANGLALDIDRYLRDEPVSAGPPSARYRVRKFVRRNRGKVAAGVAISALLVVGVAGTTGGMVWALREAAAARKAETAEAAARAQAQQNAERAAREAAEASRQAAIAAAVNAFLNQDLLAAVAPSTETGRGRDVRMREVLDEASRRIDAASRSGGRFAGEPLVEAAVRETLGETYLHLGEFKAAEPHVERALEIHGRVLGPEHRLTLAAVRRRCTLLREMGRYEEAESVLRRLREVLERVAGGDDPQTLLAMNDLAAVYSGQGRYDEALELDARVLDARERVLGPDHPATIGSIANIGLRHLELGRYDEAERYLERAVELAGQTLGEESLETHGAFNNLGLLYLRQNRLEEAEQLYGRVLELSKEVFGPTHRSTIGAMHNLALVYTRQYRSGEAEALYRAAIELQRSVLGEDHPDVFLTMNALASVLSDQGEVDEAEALFRQVIEGRGRVLPRDHAHTLTTITNLAALLYRQGRHDEAVPLFQEALDAQRRVLGESHPDTLETLNGLGCMYHDMGRLDEAEAILRETLAGRRDALGADHVSTLGTMTNLANVLRAAGRLDEARELYVESLAGKRETLGLDHPFTRAAFVAMMVFEQIYAHHEKTLGRTHQATVDELHNLAVRYDTHGRHAEAARRYEQLVTIYRETQGPEDPRTLSYMNDLASAYLELGRGSDSEALYRKTLEIRRRLLGPEHRDTLGTLTNLARALLQQGRPQEALPHYEQSVEAKLRLLGIADPWTQSAMAGLAGTYDALGRRGEALELLQKYLDYWIDLARRDDAPPGLLNQTAWVLMTYDFPELQDPETALELARRAAAQTDHGEPNILDTLALALFRTGDVAGAVVAQRRALALLPDGTPEREAFEAALERYEQQAAGAGTGDDEPPDTF
jgi:serine/threonine protein kinase/tetratricopeptide (TPR) repeat protein